MKVFLTILQFLIAIQAPAHNQLLTSITLIAPIQSLQQSNNNPILSKTLTSVFRSATSKSHPSGINPSKNGNNIIAYIGVGIAAIAGVLFAKGKKDE